MNKTIGIIGAGNMGSAFYKGLVKKFPEDKIFICDRNKSKLENIGAKNHSTDINKILKKADIIIIAVKPQSFDELISSVKVPIKEKLIISIMAGVSLSKLKKEIGAKKIIRSMPNLPIQVESGVIGWISASNLNSSDKGMVRRIFSSLGNEIELCDESKIDYITALSGSGPAYFFYLTELISKKAEKLGFSKEESRIIAERTFVGCAELLNQNQKTAKEWKNAVASKGGTTEAALNHLEKQNLEKIISEAVEKAASKSKELND